jgi:glycosyltransferase involved in cell wall biosynthesis
VGQLSVAPAVSVIVPTFQRRASVLEALATVLAQSHQDLEVIVIDDGSSDGTSAAVASLDPRVHLIEQDNAGPAAARNAGLARARGDVVAFLDSDDRWAADHVEETLALLDAHPTAVLAANQVSGLGSNGLERRTGLLDAAPDVLLGGYLYVSATVVRRSALVAIGGFDEALWVSEDTDLWCRLSLEGPFALGDRATVRAGRLADSVRERGRLEGQYPAARSRLCAHFVARVEETASRRSAAETRRLADAGLGWAAAARALVALVEDDPATVRAELETACQLFPEMAQRPERVIRRLAQSHPGWHDPHSRDRALAALADAWPGRRRHPDMSLA